MIKIGCNWSHPLRALLLENKVSLDFVKTTAFGPPWEDFAEMKTIRPVLLHGLGVFEHTGMKDVGIVDFERANRLIKECGSPHFGIHLAIEYRDLGDGMDAEAIHRRMCGVAETFKKRICVPLLLENAPDSPTDRTVYDYAPYVEPDKINRLLVDADVGFLLDLAHATVAARYHGWDVYDYLRALRLDLVREIHLNRPGVDQNGEPMDTHEAMGEEEYEMLTWVLGQSKPGIVTLEYSGVEGESGEVVTENLERQLMRIRRICC